MIKDKYEVVKRRFDEKGRRQWVAIEAKVLGRGGVTLISKATGLSRTTIVSGMKEIESIPEDTKRIRGKRWRQKAHN